MRKHPTQFVLAILILVGFLGVTMFWWTGMHEGGHHYCVSATIQSTECPNAATSEAVGFHLNTFQFFSTSTNVLQSLQLFAVLFAIAFLAVWPSTRLTANLSPGYEHRGNSRAISPPGEYQRWLSRLEHSPSIR